MPRNINDPETAKYLAKIIEYYANPTEVRSIREYTSDETNGISEATFHRLKKEFHNEIFEQADKQRKLYNAELRALTMKGLARRVAKSDNAAKLILQCMGDLVERIEQTTHFESVDQKRERLADAFAKLGFTLTHTPVSPPNQDNQNQIKH